MFGLFQKKDSFGIELGLDYIRYAHIKKNKDAVQVLDVSRHKIPASVFGNGSMQDFSYIQKNIRKYLSRNFFKTPARISLPFEGLSFFVLSIPEVSKDEQEEYIMRALQETGRFSVISDEVLDTLVLSRHENQVMDMRIVTKPKNTLVEAASFFKFLRKRNIHIERSGTAVVHIKTPSHFQETFAHVHFSDTYVSCLIIDKGKIVLHRNIQFSSSFFMKEVQKRVHESGSSAHAYMIFRGVYGSLVKDFCLKALQSLGKNISFLFDSFDTQKHGFIKKVTMSGLLSSYRGVSDVLSEFVRVPCSWVVESKDSTLYVLQTQVVHDKKSEVMEYLAPIALGNDALTLSE